MREKWLAVDEKSPALSQPQKSSLSNKLTTVQEDRLIHNTTDTTDKLYAADLMFTDSTSTSTPLTPKQFNQSVNSVSFGSTGVWGQIQAIEALSKRGVVGDPEHPTTSHIKNMSNKLMANVVDFNETMSATSEDDAAPPSMESTFLQPLIDELDYSKCPMDEATLNLKLEEVKFWVGHHDSFKQLLLDKVNQLRMKTISLSEQLEDSSNTLDVMVVENQDLSANIQKLTQEKNTYNQERDEIKGENYHFRQQLMEMRKELQLAQTENEKVTQEKQYCEDQLVEAKVKLADVQLKQDNLEQKVTLLEAHRRVADMAVLTPPKHDPNLRKSNPSNAPNPASTK
eukprot:Platyproteum_vivax@DN3988_c0_g1_i1.p1